MEKLLSKMSPAELQEKFGTKTVLGKIIKRWWGTYYISYQGKNVKLDPKKLIAAGQLSDAIGKEARIVFDRAGMIIVIIVLIPSLPHCYHILCYIPADIGLIHELEYNVRADLVNHLVANNTLPKPLGDQIISEIKAR